MTYPVAPAGAAVFVRGTDVADISLSGAPSDVSSIQTSYMAQVQRRRLYSGLALLIFILLMVSGFNIADDRNAGGFWDGLHQVGDYPADVLSEAWEKRADLPGLMAKYFPALVETVNIAAVSTLIGAIGGLFLSLLGTRGLAKWPRLIPLFRRISDIMRAVPEIVIALVLIFVLGGGGGCGERGPQACGRSFLYRGNMVPAHATWRASAGRTELCELCAAAL